LQPTPDAIQSLLFLQDKLGATSEGRIYVMAIISFEKIASDGEAEEVPDGFRRLNWDNFVAVDDELLEMVSGNTIAFRTGEAAAFTNDTGSIGFRSPDRDDDFDLNSGFFAAAYANGLEFKVFGYDDGERVAAKIFFLDPEQEFVTFGRKFDDIDEVKITARSDAFPEDKSQTPFFGVDDLFLNF